MLKKKRKNMKKKLRKKNNKKRCAQHYHHENLKNVCKTIKKLEMQNLQQTNPTFSQRKYLEKLTELPDPFLTIGADLVATAGGAAERSI